MVGTEEVQIKKSKHTVISKGREEFLIIVICTFSPPGNATYNILLVLFHLLFLKFFILTTNSILKITMSYFEELILLLKLLSISDKK
jgi:hypothetical protein